MAAAKRELKTDRIAGHHPGLWCDGIARAPRARDITEAQAETILNAQTLDEQSALRGRSDPHGRSQPLRSRRLLDLRYRQSAARRARLSIREPRIKGDEKFPHLARWT